MPSLLDQNGNPLGRPAPEYDARLSPAQIRYDRITERVVSTPNGFQIVTHQRADATVQAVHDAASLIPRKTKADGVTYLGSVPLIQAQIWARECGKPIGTSEWKEYATKKIKSRDFLKLRVAR